MSGAILVLATKISVYGPVEILLRSEQIYDILGNDELFLFSEKVENYVGGKGRKEKALKERTNAKKTK